GRGHGESSSLSRVCRSACPVVDAPLATEPRAIALGRRRPLRGPVPEWGAWECRPGWARGPHPAAPAVPPPGDLPGPHRRDVGAVHSRATLRLAPAPAGFAHRPGALWSRGRFRGGADPVD